MRAKCFFYFCVLKTTDSRAKVWRLIDSAAVRSAVVDSLYIVYYCSHCLCGVVFGPCFIVQ